MKPRNLATALAVTMLLSGCGSDEPSTSGAAESAPAAPTQAAPAPEAEPLTKAELQAALVTLEDLPAGYTPDEVSEDDDGEFEAADPACQERYDLLSDYGDDALVEAEVAFAQEPATTIEHGWGVYEASQEELSAQFAELESLVSECPESQIISTDGTPPLDLRLKPISFPDLGDDSFAMTGEVEAEGITVGLVFAFVRVGNNIQYIGQGGLGDSDPELVAKVAALGVERLPKK